MSKLTSEEFEALKRRIVNAEKANPSYCLHLSTIEIISEDTQVIFYSKDEDTLKEIFVENGFYKYYVCENDGTFKYIGFLYGENFKGLKFYKNRGDKGMILIRKFANNY